MEPRLDTLTFARYRAFRDEQHVALGRLTLVYGENNAGKSALVRLPALLAVSRTPGEPGLTLQGPPQGASFRDVQWRGALPSNEDPDLVLGASLGGVNWRWTLRWNDLAATAALAEVKLAALSLQKTDAFDGLIPPAGDPGVDAARSALVQALNGVTWLKAQREAPSRSGEPRGAPGTSWRTPTAAARQVAADAKLRQAVSAWYELHANVRIEVETLGSDLERLTLAPRKAAFAVPFSDVGEGLRAVFGVLAALEHVREKGGLLCVEEPESHLHPRLQKALAERIVEVLLAQPAASVMLETHSEIFLLAALTAAVGKLPRDAVRLHWVEANDEGAARVEPIPLDDTGRPTSDRLEQAFAVMGAMRRELLQARKVDGG